MKFRHHDSNEFVTTKLYFLSHCKDLKDFRKLDSLQAPEFSTKKKLNFENCWKGEWFQVTVNVFALSSNKKVKGQVYQLKRSFDLSIFVFSTIFSSTFFHQNFVGVFTSLKSSLLLLWITSDAIRKQLLVWNFWYVILQNQVQSCVFAEHFVRVWLHLGTKPKISCSTVSDAPSKRGVLGGRQVYQYIFQFWRYDHDSKNENCQKRFLDRSMIFWSALSQHRFI